jgi:hypothetical protein
VMRNRCSAAHRCATKFSPLIITMNNEYCNKINDIIIKIDNYEHQIENFSVGVDL